MNATDIPSIEEIRTTTVPILMRYGATRAGVFGSIVYGKARRGSDVDILVEISADLSLLEFARIISLRRHWVEGQTSQSTRPSAPNQTADSDGRNPNPVRRDPRLYLDDNIQSLDLIQQHTVGTTEEEFYRTVLVQDAVMRRLEIIGEAAKHLPIRMRDKYPDVPWRDIVGMRNILAHEYS